MKKLIYFFEFIIVYALFIIFKIIGYKTSSNLGFIIGKYFGPIFRPKSLIIKNLKKANISGKKIFIKLQITYWVIMEEFLQNTLI